MNDNYGYCLRCVMWINLDVGHSQVDCDTYRNSDIEFEQLAHWIEPAHPTWFPL